MFCCGGKAEPAPERMYGAELTLMGDEDKTDDVSTTPRKRARVLADTERVRAAAAATLPRRGARALVATCAVDRVRVRAGVA